MIVDKFMIDRDQKTPMYQQIYEYYKNGIMNREVLPREKLPSVRELSKELAVSKITVESAYQQLLAEGYVENKPRRGYFAVELKELPFTYALGQQQERVHEKARNDGSDLKTEEKSYPNTGVDPQSFEIPIWRKLYSEVLKEGSTKIHETGRPSGEEELKEEIQKFIGKSRGVVARKEQIVIGSGSQYLLGIVAALVRKEHQKVIVEDPGFEQARHTFEDYGFVAEPIPVDEKGIQIDQMYRSDGRLAYVSPSHQYPLGTVMPVKRRLEVLQWARDRTGLIIEDDYDSIIRYETEPIPSLQGIDKGMHVIYLGSFSKLITPAIRISYMVLTEELTEVYQQNKHRFTQTASKLEQKTLAKYMKEKHFERHLRRINKIYYKKNQFIKEKIRMRYGDQVEVIGGNSGLHLVLRPITREASENMQKRFAENNIYFETIEGKEENQPLLLLTYSGLQKEDIDQLF